MMPMSMKKRMVSVWLFKRAAQNYGQSIAKGDASAHNAAATAVSVNKGDRIYFRVQSGTEEMGNGAFDEVVWHPVITYTGLKK